MTKTKVLFAEVYGDLADLYNFFWGKTYDISICENGLEAWHKINSGYLPDIIVSDFHMPELDGVGLALKLKEAGYKIPFILFSIYFPYRTDNLSLYGIDCFLDKLTEYNFLESKISQLASKHASS